MPSARSIRAALVVATALALLGGCAVSPGAPGAVTETPATTAPSASATATADDCRGAAAIVEAACADVAVSGFTPSVEEARGDTSAVYAETCRSDTATTEVRECVFGPADGRRVALIGDSHAAIWFPALEPIAEARGWRLQVFYRSACSFSLAPRVFEGGDLDQLDRCLQWNLELQRVLASAEPFELVVTASFSGMRFLDDDGAESDAAGIRGYQDAWQPLLDRGTDVVVLAEPPLLGLERLACQLASPVDPLPCSPSPAEARAENDLAAEAARDRGLPVVDLTPAFCTDEQCPTVAGGVLVYRDEHHFTGTFGRTLAPYLERELQSIGVID